MVELNDENRQEIESATDTSAVQSFADETVERLNKISNFKGIEETEREFLDKSRLLRTRDKAHAQIIYYDLFARRTQEVLEMDKEKSSDTDNA